MLKGLVFELQTFTHEAFALFIDKFLNGRCGVARGCSLSNTSTSVTIGEGYFVIRGRFLKIIDGETISNLSNNGYYSLVCEVDLSKSNSLEQFNQASIKTIYNATTYPTLTQQDITENGTKYQYEFARFKISSGSISEFQDMRTYIDFDSIYNQIQGEYREILQQLKQELDNVKDGSAYLLKDSIKIINGTIQMPEANTDSLSGTLLVPYPEGFTSKNCVILSVMGHNNLHPEYWTTPSAIPSTGVTLGVYDLIASLRDNGVWVRATKADKVVKRDDVTFKVALLKVS